MAAIFGETNFFLKIGMATLKRYPVGQKFRRNHSYLARFSRYYHFCVLQFLRKNSKIQNGHHFWQDKIFWKIGMATLQRYL